MAAASVGSGNVGCLVTQEITLEEENRPPSLFDAPQTSTPIGELVRVNLSDLEANEIPFELQVRDEDISQTLKTRYYFHTLDPTISAQRPQKGADVVPSGDAIRRFGFSIVATQLTAGRCYQVELLVTSDFDDSPDVWDQPKQEGDIARAKWHLAVDSREPEAIADLNTCPFVEYNPGTTENP